MHSQDLVVVSVYILCQCHISAKLLCLMLWFKVSRRQSLKASVQTFVVVPLLCATNTIWSIIIIGLIVTQTRAYLERVGRGNANR